MNKTCIFPDLIEKNSPPNYLSETISSLVENWSTFEKIHGKL